MDFFTTSKLLGTLIAPGNLIILMFITGLTLTETRYRRLGRWITCVTAATSIIFLLLPVGSWAMSPLENRFARPRLPYHVDGILVLGGGENPQLFASRGTGAVIVSEGRLAEAVELSRRFPQARVVFTGIEAEVARAAFEQIGYPTDRIAFEKDARNTWENLLFSKNLIGPRSGETWLLVTHAVSIPRAIGVARKVGWDMLPWPVDYQTGTVKMSLSLHFVDNVARLEAATHEWIGLFVYRFTGRSAAWFPSPKDPAELSPD